MSTENLIFLLGYLLVLGIVVALFRAVGLSFLRPSIPMLFVVSYLVFCYLGSPILVFGLDREALALDATDRSLTLRVWAYNGATLVLVCLGFVFARWGMRLRPRQSAPVVIERARFSMFRVVIVLMACLVAFGLYVQVIQVVPLLGLLQGLTTAQLQQARSSATNALEHAWRYLVFPDHVAPFLSYVLLSAYLTQKRRRYLIGFLLAGAIATFSANMDLVRSLFVLYLASLVFLYYLAQRKSIPVGAGALYMIAAGGFLIGLILAISRSELESVVQGTLTRIFDGYLLSSYYYLQIFPRFHDYLLGQSFPNPGGLLPFEYFPLTVFVSRFIFGEVSGVVGSAPAPFWAEMYANFGPVGALLSAFLVGVALWFLHVWTTTRPQSPIYDGLITYLAFYIRPLSTSDLSTYLFPLEVFVVLAVALFISPIRMRRQIVFQSPSSLVGEKVTR